MLISLGHLSILRQNHVGGRNKNIGIKSIFVINSLFWNIGFNWNARPFDLPFYKIKKEFKKKKNQYYLLKILLTPDLDLQPFFSFIFFSFPPILSNDELHKISLIYVTYFIF